jgi:hypothetical protein
MDMITARVSKYDELKSMFSLPDDNVQELKYDRKDVNSSLMSLRSGKILNPLAGKSNTQVRKLSLNDSDQGSQVDNFNPMQKLSSPVKSLLQKYNFVVSKTTDTKILEIRKAVGLLPSGLFLLYPDNKEGETKFKADYEKYIRQLESYEKAVSISYMVRNI